MSKPTESTLRWVAEVTGAAVLGVDGLNRDSAPWLVRLAGDADAVLRVGNAADDAVRTLFRTEVAALHLTATHGIPAPRLLAARLHDTDRLNDADRPQRADQREPGPARPDRHAAAVDDHQLALLTTVVAGSSTIPREATTERLHNLGATAGALARVTLGKDDHGLDPRGRPIESVDFAMMRRTGDTTPLLAEADELMAALPRPRGPDVLVHGDLWQANIMWDGDRVVGLIDWDCAGVGHPGVDLGSARFDAALMFGLPAVKPVLDGWRAAAGRDPGGPGDVAYWDVVAALSAPADLGYFMPVIHGQGRTDLTQEQAVERRDAFLRAALTRLG